MTAPQDSPWAGLRVAVVGDGDPAARPLREFLRSIAVVEKRWPPIDVVTLLRRPVSSFISVYGADDQVAGAAHVLHARPYPCEQPPFSFAIPDDGRVAWEVALIAVAREWRRSATGGVVLDGLMKGIHRLQVERNGTHLYTLCELWMFHVLTDGYAKLSGRPVSEGKHYWCGTALCPGPHCQLTYVCEIDLHQSEERLQAERPDFWEYVQSPNWSALKDRQ
jgi:hypothetical protein